MRCAGRAEPHSGTLAAGKLRAPQHLDWCKLGMEQYTTNSGYEQQHWLQTISTEVHKKSSFCIANIAICRLVIQHTVVVNVTTCTDFV
jgi:hypothetical protein